MIIDCNNFVLALKMRVRIIYMWGGLLSIDTVP